MNDAPSDSSNAIVRDAFRLQFERSSDTIMLLDAKTMLFTEVNPAGLVMLGVPRREDIVNFGPADLSPELQLDGRPSASGAMEMIGLALQHGTHRFDWLCRRMTGEPFMAEVLLTCLDDHERTNIMVTVRDVTERKANDLALAAERARLKATLDVALDCIVTIDAAGLVLDWNPSAEQTFGWSRAEVLGREMAEIIIPVYLREGHRQGMARAAMGEMRMVGQRVELTALHRSGETFPVELSISRVETGGAPIYTGFIRDISKRKAAEAKILALNADLERRVNEATAVLRQQAVALSESNLTLTRFKAVTDATSDFVAIITLKGEALYLNPAGRTLVGIDLDENLSGVSYERWSTPEYIRLSNEVGFQTAMEHGHWHSDVTLKHREGYEIPVSFVGVVIKLEDSTPTHFAGIARDISKRVAMEKQLRSSLTDERDLNELKTNFVNMISHEFRTPLGVIMSSTEILTKYFERLSPVLRQEHLNDVLVATRRMGAMMEEVLLLASADAGSLLCKPEPIDLAAFCHILVVDIDSSTVNKCPIAVTFADTDWQVKADPALLRHIFTNLLNNAVKYSATGVGVHLRLGRCGEEVIFEVIDKGMGIPEQDLDRLFTAFHRGGNVGTTSGTGLGLGIVKRCVGLHHGSITVQSVEGKGTTFTVRLPLFAQ